MSKSSVKHSDARKQSGTSFPDEVFADHRHAIQTVAEMGVVKRFPIGRAWVHCKPTKLLTILPQPLAGRNHSFFWSISESLRGQYKGSRDPTSEMTLGHEGFGSPSWAKNIP
jgi:hypothetical protein